MPLAARAAVVAADVAQHPRLRRHDVELFADHLAQARELDPVMRTGALASRRRVLDVDPLERVGQQGACRPRAPMGRDLGAGVGLGLLARLGLSLVEPPSCPSGSFSDDAPKRRASSSRTCSCSCSMRASRCWIVASWRAIVASRSTICDSNCCTRARNEASSSNGTALAEEVMAERVERFDPPRDRMS